MRKIIPAVCFSFLTISASAQVTQGAVTYERTTQMQIQLQGMPAGVELPKSRTDQFELIFGNNKSLWKQAERPDDDQGNIDQGGVQIRVVMSGSDDVLFTDLASGKKTEKKELMGKNFIIDDSVSKLSWKLTGETKTILGYPCMKATATRISTRSSMNMINGKTERKEEQDTANIIAWFTSAIPVSAGPGEFQVQLPGLILEMDISNGKQVFKALSIREKADISAIKEPAGKKRHTAAEFKVEREKMMEEMQKNNQGGRNFIRVN